MNSEKFVASFAEFAAAKGIDKPTVIRMLEDVLRMLIIKKFGTDSNFDIVINPNKGDLQVWRTRQIVADDAIEQTAYDKISLSEARKIEPDFEIGEEVAEEVDLDIFGRRDVMQGLQLFTQKQQLLEKSHLYEKYKRLLGYIIRAEVYQILRDKTILYDDEHNECILPKTEQLSRDFFKKGQHIRAIVHDIKLVQNDPRIILSRTSPRFLEKLMEAEVPEIADGSILIKQVVRIPGVRSKITVTTYDDRIDPVGACIGVRGTRIYSLIRELRNEQIDVINDSENLQVLLTRALAPAKLSSIKEMSDRIGVYLNKNQVALALGVNGQNIELASRLIGKPIDIYRELEQEEETDIDIQEFADEIEPWVIEAFQRAGLDTAKSILQMPKEDLKRCTELEPETLEAVLSILGKEFAPK